MEITLDKRIYYVAIAAILLIAAIVAMSLVSSFLSEKEKNEKKENGDKMALLKESICSRKTEIEMYIQDPGSRHPFVLRLLKDMQQYNSYASQEGLKEIGLPCDR